MKVHMGDEGVLEERIDDDEKHGLPESTTVLSSKPSKGYYNTGTFSGEAGAGP